MRGVASEALWAATGYSDRYREEIARAILSRAGLEVPNPAAGGAGLPPLLAAMLNLVFLADGLTEDLFSMGLRSSLRGWTLRWLGDVVPSDRDAAFVLDVARRLANASEESDTPEERKAKSQRELSVVVRSLGHCRDAETEAFLERIFESHDPFAAAALSRRGRADALADLVEASRTDQVALALLLEFAPETARRVLWRRIADDTRSVSQMLERLGDLEFQARCFRIRWRDDALAPLAALMARDLPHGPLKAAALGVSLPGCATARLADAVIDALFAELADEEWRKTHLIRPTPLFPEEEDSLDRDVANGVIAFLEVARPERFRELLRAWSEVPVEDTELLAVVILTRLGDPLAAGGLAELRDRRRADDEAHDTCASLWELADTKSRDVFDAITEQSHAGASAPTAPGVAASVQEQAAAEILRFLAESEDVDLPQPILEHIDAERGVEALALALEAVPLPSALGAFWKTSPGWIRDERIARWLRNIQQRRELGLYAWATGELSLMGDAAARAETWAVIRAGRYYWLDELDADVLTNGRDLETLPYWIEELQSQCCRIHMSDTVLEVLDPRVGWSHDAQGAAMTSYEYAARLWSRHRGRFAWSRWAGRFIPVPE